MPWQGLGPGTSEGMQTWRGDQEGQGRSEDSQSGKGSEIRILAQRQRQQRKRCHKEEWPKKGWQKIKVKWKIIFNALARNFQASVSSPVVAQNHEVVMFSFYNPKLVKRFNFDQDPPMQWEMSIYSVNTLGKETVFQIGTSNKFWATLSTLNKGRA